MKNCAFNSTNSSIIFTLSLVISTLAGFFFSKGLAFSVVRSIKRNGMGDVDSFSNPISTCSPLGCLQVLGNAGCKPGDCCICKCSLRFPNYIVHSGTCVENERVDPVCELTTIPTERLMPVKDFSRAGIITFEVEIDRPLQCPGIELRHLYYQLDTAVWIKGPNSVFRLTRGRNGNRWNLLWDKGLDRKYYGLILSFDFYCVGQNVTHGCLVVKSKGNYSLAALSSSQPTTDGPSQVAVTEGKVEPTDGSHEAKGGVSNGGRGENFAGQNRGVAIKNYSVIVVGVSLSVVMGIGLICFVMLRKGGPLWLKLQRRPKAPPYEEPRRPAGIRPIRTSVHNEFYDAGLVLSIGGQTAEAPKRLSRLGPLPPLPTKGESIYEEPVVIRNVGYHGLARQNRPSTAPIKRAPVHHVPIRCKPIHSEPIQTEAISDQNPDPFYNILEELPETDDYDDTTECRCKEVDFESLRGQLRTY